MAPLSSELETTDGRRFPQPFLVLPGLETVPPSDFLLRSRKLVPKLPVYDICHSAWQSHLHRGQETESAPSQVVPRFSSAGLPAFNCPTLYIMLSSNYMELYCLSLCCVTTLTRSFVRGRLHAADCPGARRHPQYHAPARTLMLYTSAILSITSLARSTTQQRHL